MDEFDEFDPEHTPGEDGADFDDGLDAGDASAFEPFDDDDAGDDIDLDTFDFSDPGEGGLDTALTDFDDGLGTDEEGAEPERLDEAPFAGSAEDLALAEADNPSAFPPELDLDVPPPIDGMPWIDVNALGSSETEPWVNTTESTSYDDLDADPGDPASAALARFWGL